MPRLRRVQRSSENADHLGAHCAMPMNPPLEPHSSDGWAAGGTSSTACESTPGEWSDEDWIPISALQHYSYCPRQCALIHVDQVWADNAYTLRGKWSHERVDLERVSSARSYPVATALPVWSDRLGLIGKCDAVEFRGGVPYPVEFKLGRSATRRWIHDAIQLAAQALCLEEMFGVLVPEGAVFHVQSHRRRLVRIGEDLKRRVVTLVHEVRAMIREGVVPPPVYDARCRACSLRSVCMPELRDGDWVAVVTRTLAQDVEGAKA